MTKLSSADICRPAAVLPVVYLIGGPSGIRTGFFVHDICVI